MQLPPELRKCVCYVEVLRDGHWYLNGTAFFVCVPEAADVEPKGYHVYAVTAKHVLMPEFTADEDKRPYELIRFRLNLLAGGTGTILVPLNSWAREDKTDVAAVPCRAFLGPRGAPAFA